MKLVVSSNDLLKGMLLVQKAIPAKASQAILENYLLELSGGKLIITASDMEMILKTEVEVQSAEEEGRIAVPAKQITDLLKELPDQPLTIKTISENSFECEWISGCSTLPYFNAADYPALLSVEPDAISVSFPAEVLVSGISNTIYASSDEDNRPVMSSIFFDLKPEICTFVASDLQKLICYTTIEVKPEQECSFILNKRHANVLRGVLGKESGDVVASFGSKVVVFSFGSTTMTCSLVVGKYPDYKTIVPKNNSNILTISRTQLLNTVRRIAVCSPKASNHIKLELSANALEISAQDLGYEIAAHDKVSCDYKGEELAIGFKSTHVIEILSNFSCENVIIKFADKRRSVVILPDDEDSAADKVFGIVMPIMVR